MKKNKIPYAIEGILFAAGEPVKTAKLAAVLEIEIEAVEEAMPPEAWRDAMPEEMRRPMMLLVKAIK